MEAFFANAFEKGGLTAVVVLFLALGAWRAVGKAWQVFSSFLADVVNGQKDMTRQFVESMSSVTAEMKAQREAATEQHHETLGAISNVSERVARIEARGDERDGWDSTTPVNGRYGNGQRKGNKP